MAKTSKKLVTLISVTAVAMATVVFFKFGEANLSHQTSASGILTMQECLECHSGVAARKPISICLDDHCLYTKNHSMMHIYPPPGKEMRYASVFEITQAGCILEDGKITCLSCHDLTKPPPHLIKSGADLCFICHKDLRP